jgi:ferritin-like metal-binding protein YciE
VLTIEDVRAWTGRTAQDPYGVALGTIAGTLHDEQTGSPEWLVISPDDSDAEGVLVPVGGALPTGRRIRVVPIAGVVRTAPRVRIGESINVASKRQAAAHYGLALDSDASGSGQLRDRDALRPEAVAEPADAIPPVGDPHKRAEIVQALQAAHAMEQASLRLLAAMRWRLQDEELVHDVAFHHKATNRHAERLRERLDELEAGRGRPLEWAARRIAYVQAQLGRFRSHPDPADLRQAHAFEQGEAAAYERLEQLARDAGDSRTAALARANRADELAMVMTIEQSRLWPSRKAPSGGPAEEAPRT